VSFPLRKQVQDSVQADLLLMEDILLENFIPYIPKPLFKVSCMSNKQIPLKNMKLKQHPSHYSYRSLINMKLFFKYLLLFDKKTFTLSRSICFCYMIAKITIKYLKVFFIFFINSVRIKL